MPCGDNKLAKENDICVNFLSKINQKNANIGIKFVH